MEHTLEEQANKIIEDNHEYLEKVAYNMYMDWLSGNQTNEKV